MGGNQGGRREKEEGKGKGKKALICHAHVPTLQNKCNHHIPKTSITES